MELGAAAAIVGIYGGTFPVSPQPLSFCIFQFENVH